MEGPFSSSEDVQRESYKEVLLDDEEELKGEVQEYQSF